MSEFDYVFKCPCGFEFKCGIINKKEHTIFCPKCDQEIDVDPEINLVEGECPLLEEYRKNREAKE